MEVENPYIVIMGSVSIPHIVAVALPLQGHINPMFHFVKTIASKGVTVTVVNTESAHAEILQANRGKDPFVAMAESMGVDIRSIQVSDGLPLSFDRNRNRDEYWEAMLVEMIHPVRDLMARLVAESPPVTCMVVDTFYVWPRDISREFQIPFATFFTQCVAAFSIDTHWQLLENNHHVPYPETADENVSIIDYIPGLPAMRVTDLPSFLQEPDISTSLHKVVKLSLEVARDATWVLSNSVDELEPETVSAMKELGIPFMSVGPILPDDFKENSLGTSLWKEADCMQWLDRQPKESVIYISFGSYAKCTKELIHEVAFGIMESKQPFIWVLRPDIVEGCGADEVLPNGFEAETREQGMVVKWCSQLNVLRHPAIGAFATHCGWNSIMEGIWIGVPLMGFPLMCDQYTNRWLTEERLGVCSSLAKVTKRSRAERRALVCRHDVAQSIVGFMEQGVKRSMIKQNAEWARDTIRKAVLDPQGSSSLNLERFIRDIDGLCNGSYKR